MLEIGKVYRLSKKEKSRDVTEVDGLQNFFHETSIPHAGTQFEVQRGIHVFSKIKGSDGKERIPMIFITSSPYKAGSVDTPWKDSFDPDHGRVKYFGDNKSSQKEPGDTAGNKALLSLMQVYRSNDSEIRASEGVPLLYFERVTVDGRVKGNLKFQGFGIAIAAKLVTQVTFDKHTEKKDYFLNYQYDFVVLSLKQEKEKFDFIKWIGARYDTTLSVVETNQYAPQSWQDWIREGIGDLPQIRRNVPSKKIVRYSDQLPHTGSVEFKLLTEIYEQYAYGTKNRKFEALAIEIIRKVIEENNSNCEPGWILPDSEVFNKDFVVRMDIGTDVLTGVRIPVIGHANCVRPIQAINNVDMEHIYDIAKLEWAVAYVTTSFFSESVQKGVFASKRPFILINGRKLAQVVHEELLFNKVSLDEYLDLLEKKYSVENKAPEEIIDK